MGAPCPSAPAIAFGATIYTSPHQDPLAVVVELQLDRIRLRLHDGAVRVDEPDRLAQ